MSETTCPESLRNAGDDELAALYGSADEATARLVLTEAARRDRLERGRAARNAISADWFLFAHAQYLAADAECRGNLLSRAGIAAGVDAWSLWSGPAVRVELYASEELREFWLTNQRVTVKQYAAQVRQANREAWEAGGR
jgi:hypothetical protein